MAEPVVAVYYEGDIELMPEVMAMFCFGGDPDAFVWCDPAGEPLCTEHPRRWMEIPRPVEEGK